MSALTLGAPRTRRSPRIAGGSQLRLTRRGRFVVFLAGLAVVCVAFVAWGPSVIATGQAGDPVPVRTVTVGAGETMWDIADEANPSGDIRQTVHDIAELNSLPSAGELEVGQEIAVPRY